MNPAGTSAFRAHASSPRIGCSGWTDDDWRGPFYPETVKLKDRLRYDAGRFDTTEINGGFYRLPTDKAIAAWAEQVPEGFRFASASTAWGNPRANRPRALNLGNG